MARYTTIRWQDDQGRGHTQTTVRRSPVVAVYRLIAILCACLAIATAITAAQSHTTRCTTYRTGTECTSN